MSHTVQCVYCIHMLQRTTPFLSHDSEIRGKEDHCDPSGQPSTLCQCLAWGRCLGKAVLLKEPFPFPQSQRIFNKALPNLNDYSFTLKMLTCIF